MKRIDSTILVLPFVAGVRFPVASMVEFYVGHTSEYDTSMQADASERDYCGEESSDKYIMMAELKGASTKFPACFLRKSHGCTDEGPKPDLQSDLHFI